MESTHTIVEYTAEHEGYRCGYCKCSNTSYSHGMWAHQMSVQDYQDLIDRGWRRSGKYCYKPTMSMTCCPQYTIKCNVLDFQLNKSHKKLLKRVNRFLITGVKAGEGGGGEESKKEDEEMENVRRDIKSPEMDLAEKAKPSGDDVPTVKSIQHTVQNTPKGSDPVTSQGARPEKSASSDKSGGNSAQPKHVPRPGDGPDQSRPPSRKAKAIRLERRLSKQASNPDMIVEKRPKNEAKTLEDYLSEPNHVHDSAHKLELRLVRSTPPSAIYTSTFRESHKVYHRYQTTIHKDPPGKPSESQYKRFLCDSPLAEEFRDDGPPKGYGSFHQHYILDGKIIAVGVIDILPSCVSSVYLYYDPEYSFLGLGVYSALREIAFVRQLARQTPALHNYYMGFYIHSCPKMRYKGQYVPSFISCPETYTWVPIERCRPKMDASRYARLSEQGVEDKDKDIDLNQVLVLCKGNVMPYAIYKMMKKGKVNDEAEVKQYASFVGKTCAERMFLVRK